MASVSKSPKTAAPKAGSTTKKPKAAAKASATPKSKTTKSKADGKPSTRTSSRSAKRRSPKEAAEERLNNELCEVERVQFLRAMDAYKRKTGKTFPSWTEVLDVLRSVGWLSPVRLAALEDSEAA